MVITNINGDLRCMSGGALLNNMWPFQYGGKPHPITTLTSVRQHKTKNSQTIDKRKKVEKNTVLLKRNTIKHEK
jgi:hypothetical protein